MSLREVRLLYNLNCLSFYLKQWSNSIQTEYLFPIFLRINEKKHTKTQTVHIVESNTELIDQ